MQLLALLERALLARADALDELARRVVVPRLDVGVVAALGLGGVLPGIPLRPRRGGSRGSGRPGGPARRDVLALLQPLRGIRVRDRPGIAQGVLARVPARGRHVVDVGLVALVAHARLEPKIGRVVCDAAGVLACCFGRPCALAQAGCRPRLCSQRTGHEPIVPPLGLPAPRTLVASVQGREDLCTRRMRTNELCLGNPNSGEAGHAVDSVVDALGVQLRRLRSTNERGVLLHFVLQKSGSAHGSRSNQAILSLGTG